MHYWPSLQRLRRMLRRGEPVISNALLRLWMVFLASCCSGGRCSRVCPSFWPMDFECTVQPLEGCSCFIPVVKQLGPRTGKAEARAGLPVAPAEPFLPCPSNFNFRSENLEARRVRWGHIGVMQAMTKPTIASPQIQVLEIMN